MIRGNSHDSIDMIVHGRRNLRSFTRVWMAVLRHIICPVRPMTVQPAGVPSRVMATSTTDRVPDGDLDAALTAQLLVAWAGEKGRLDWWRCDLVSRFGGLDLFADLTPETREWSALQAAREAARRHDRERRTQHSDPDTVLTLFHLGFECDEQLDERLSHHKRSGAHPFTRLPGLADFVRLPCPDEDDPEESFARDLFEQFLRGDAGKIQVDPTGRRLPGVPPSNLPDLVRQLLAALVPLTQQGGQSQYPLPYFRRPRT